MDETNELIQQRVRKLDELRKEEINPFPNQYKVKDTSKDILETCGSLSDEELHEVDRIFTVAGRIVAVRDFGKASFVQIQDRKGRIQAYVRKDLVGESAYAKKTPALYRDASMGKTDPSFVPKVSGG